MIFFAKSGFKGLEHQQTILRLLHKCITPIVSSGLEIFSTFKIHHQHPVYGCFIRVLFNLTKSTIVNHRFGPAVRPADERNLTGKKVSDILKNSS